MIENLPNLPDVKGHIKLDLIDPYTEKITESIEHDNAVMSSISKTFQNFQRFYWMALNNNNGAGMAGSLVNSPYMASHVLLTTDTTTPTETSNALSGSLVGYASRWAAATSGTKRGSVNTALCSLSQTQSQWVWDWPTTAANGTFQTVSFGTVQQTVEKYLTESPILHTTGGVSSGWGGASGTSTNSNQVAMCYSGGNTYIAYPSGTGAGAAVTVATIDPINGGSPTVVFTCSGAGTLTPTLVYSMVRLTDGSFILATNTGITKVSSTGVFQASATGITACGSLATDGTVVWGINDATSAVYTLNYGSNPITTSAAFTISSSTNTTNVSPVIAYDGTNILALAPDSTGGIIELRTYSTAGTLLSTSNGGWWHGAGSETAVSPYSGSVFWPPDGGGVVSITGASSTSAMSSGLPTISGSGSTDLLEAPFLSLASMGTAHQRRMNPFGLNWGPDGLWFKYYQTATGATTTPGYGWGIYRISYNNVSTRALLDNPFTKTSSNALRLTYTLTFA